MFDVLVKEAILNELENQIATITYRKANGKVSVYDMRVGKIKDDLCYLGFVKPKGKGCPWFSVFVWRIERIEQNGVVLF
jgi:hypothetical protein